MTMSIGFTPATIADLDILLLLIEEFCAYDGHPFDAQELRSVVERIVCDESLGRVWLIQADGATVGYVALTFGYSLEYRGRDAFVDELYIREGYRRLSFVVRRSSVVVHPFLFPVPASLFPIRSAYDLLVQQYRLDVRPAAG
jgi:hypothetical protein